MDKGHGGSSRLSSSMRQTGGDSNVFLNKSSKKVKFLDHCGTINHTSATRSPRSDEIGGLKDWTIESLVTKDEEEVAEALFSLAQTFNKTSELELVETVHVDPPNEADVIKSEGNKSRKRSWVHVYICHFIKSDVTGVNVISNEQAL